MRVYEFARNYEMTSKELVVICQELGIDVKAQSKLDETQIATLSRHFSREAEVIEEVIKREEEVKAIDVCVATECEPFTTLGELGKVMNGTIKEMTGCGEELIVFLPKYASLSNVDERTLELIMELPIKAGAVNEVASIYKLTLESVTYLFVGNEAYFGREEIYGYEDDVERFAFYNRAILEVLPKLERKVSRILVNDWHTSMIPLLLTVDYKYDTFYEGVETILNIHNLEYQGWCQAESLPTLLGISRQYYDNGLTRMGDAVNLLKSGIQTASKVVLQGTSCEQLELPELKQSGLAKLIENRLEQNIA